MLPCQAAQTQQEHRAFPGGEETLGSVPLQPRHRRQTQGQSCSLPAPEQQKTPLVKRWCIYPEMTRSLISLARHALPALLCPWKATKQPNPSQGGIERQERGEGEWGKKPFLPRRPWVQTHHNKQRNPKPNRDKPQA